MILAPAMPRGRKRLCVVLSCAFEYIVGRFLLPLLLLLLLGASIIFEGSDTRRDVGAVCGVARGVPTEKRENCMLLYCGCFVHSFAKKRYGLFFFFTGEPKEALFPKLPSPLRFFFSPFWPQGVPAVDDMI